MTPGTCYHRADDVPRSHDVVTLSQSLSADVSAVSVPRVVCAARPTADVPPRHWLQPVAAS